VLVPTPPRRRAHRLTLLALALLLLCTALPGQPVRAEEFTQALDDAAGDFASGNGVSLQRIAVSNEQVGIADLPGALVLAPIGELPTWSALSTLPAPRANHAVVSLGRHIYVIAGAEVGEDSVTNSAYGNSVNPRTGAFEGAWTNVPLVSGTLFARPASGTECFRDVIGSARSNAAAASLLTATQPPNPNDPDIYNASGFIYVIGGLIDSFNDCNTIYATPQVQIGTVVNGVITGWTTTPANNLLTITGSLSGVLGASAVVVRRADKAYLYVIGGRTSSNIVSKAVFYTELDLTTGALKHPLGVAGSPWRSTAELPGPTGLFQHSAVWSRGTTADPVTAEAITNDAIFVAGGYTNNTSTTANANIYRADVGDDGALTWELEPGLANPATNALEGVTIGEQGRAGMAGFSQGGQLYFLGGTIPNTGVQQSMVAGAHDGELRLLKLFDDGAEYFLSSEGSSPAKVPPALRRAFLGVAVVPAVLPSPVSTDRAPVAAWAFALGGSNEGGLPQADIFYAELGGDASTARARSAEGWYFSQYHDVRLNVDDELVEARVLAVEWTTSINRQLNTDADLKIEFRTSRRLCTELSSVFQAEQDIWRELPLTESGFASVNGANSISVSDAFGDVDASCLQYRVYFSQNGVVDGRPQPPNNNAKAETPKLLNVGLRTTRTGTRDLFIDTFAIGLNAEGQVNSFDLRIKNLSPDGREDTALNAGTGGPFPVVLCVARTELDASPPTLEVPTVPITGGGNRVGCAPAYNYIPKENMTPDTAVYVTKNWKANFTNNPLLPGINQDAAIEDIRALFSTPGQYAVAAIIDPFGSVDEQGRTQNNRSKQPDSEPLILRFNVLAEGFDDTDPLPGPDPDPDPEPEGNTVYLPLISR
jgi:hypothetical protein